MNARKWLTDKKGLTEHDFMESGMIDFISELMEEWHSSLIPSPTLTRDTAIELIKEYCRNNNMRVTPERLTIVDNMPIGLKFGVEQIYLLMKNKGLRVSRATLYNNIELLSKCGIIRTWAQSGNVVMYKSNIK